MFLANDIKNVNSKKNAVTISRKILNHSNCDSTLELSYVSYLTGKHKKYLSKKINAWLIAFKLRIPEDHICDPDLIWVELYPELGEFHIPYIF